MFSSDGEFGFWVLEGVVMLVLLYGVAVSAGWVGPIN